MSPDGNTESETIARLASAGRVAAGLAHELGNPLCAITNYAHSLEEKVAPELRPTVQAMQREVARIQRMMDGIIDYTRPRDPGSLGADVNVALRETLSFLTEQGIFRRITIDAHLDDAPLPVNAKPLELEQAFANLLLNAADAMPAGGRLALSTRRDVEANVAEIVIADSGPGIERGHEERIFEPFVTTKPPEHGTGLGLSIVRGIVNMMGGRVWVERSSEGGAAFHIVAPVFAANSAATNPPR
jgi:two-component system NtrC family sensor kinase